MEAVSVLVAASQAQGLPLGSLISTHHQPNALQQVPAKTVAGQFAQPPAPLTPRPRFTVRHAEDAIFERWSDPVVDLLARDFWK